MYLRQLETLSSAGDVFFAYSTSGNSENVIRAVRYARENEIFTIGFTGNEGGELSSICDISFVVPSFSTALIQEVHTMLGHVICGAVEEELAKSG